MVIRGTSGTTRRARRLAIGIGLTVGLLCLPACAQHPPATKTPLPATVAQALQRAGIPDSALSALVIPVDPREPERLRVRADAEVNPASVMKLVTTYAAIDLLGPDFTWQTRFYTDGSAQGGALHGNLYVRGDGDPKLVLERLQEAFFALQARGVQVILGDMVLDHSAFELPAHDPGAFDGEALRPYNAAPDALLFNFKSVILRFTPDRASGRAIVSSEPPMEGLSIDTQVPLAPGACGDWRTALRARFDRPDAIRFEGRYPGACGELTWPVAYQDPDSYAVRAFEGMWRASGGAITGRVRTGQTPPGVKLLYEAHSLPLSDIIVDVNQWSNNVMAQQVFLTLGRLPPLALDEATPIGGRSLQPVRTGRFERSRETLRHWWVRTFGLKVSPPVLDNGSGLSRSERITSEALANLLRHAAAHPRGEAFVQSLSVAGVKGTAARIGQRAGSLARGNAWLKTGTLRDVSGIAGYVHAINGHRYVVIGFVNHDNASAARPALDALVEWSAALR